MLTRQSRARHPQEPHAFLPEFRNGTAENYGSQRFFELDTANRYWQSEHADHLPDVMMGTNSEVPS